MQIEIYQREVIENATPDFPDVFDEWERRAQLVEDLGLVGQKQYMDALEKAKKVPFKLLGPDEWLIWRRCLTERYLEDESMIEAMSRHRDPNRLADYRFDLIPIAVLEAWRQCKQMGYFDAYEIRTAEGNPDPILIGRLGPLVFLIARWGESLKPLEEIVREREVRQPLRRLLG